MRIGGLQREMQRKMAEERRRAQPMRQGEPKRQWELKDLSWSCATCAGCRVKGGAARGAADAAKGTGESACGSCGGGQGAPPPAAPTPTPTAPAAPAAPTPLTAAARTIYKQYYDVCKAPDEHQLTLLGAVSGRTAAEVRSWFHERERNERLEKQRRAEREVLEKRRREEIAALAANPSVPKGAHGGSGGGGGGGLGGGLGLGGLGGLGGGTPASCADAAAIGGAAAFARGAARPLSDDTKQLIQERREAGNKAYYTGHYVEALAFYQQALQLDPANRLGLSHVVHSNISAVHGSMHQWMESLKSGMACVRLKPQYAKGYSRIGTALANMGQTDEAITYFHRSIALDPSSEASKRSIEQLELRKSQIQQPAKGGTSVPTPATLPTAPTHAGAPQSAQNGMAGASHAAPTAPPPGNGAVKRASQEGSSLTYSQLGATKKARVGPGAPPAPGAPPQWLPVKDEAASSTAASSTAASSTAASAAAANPSGSEAEMRQRGSALQHQGNAAYKRGDHSAAVELFTQALTFTNMPQLYSNRSAAYAGLGDFTRALKDADHCVGMKPEWSKAHSRRGNALHGLRRLQEARLAYKRALELDPQNAVVGSSLAGCEALIKQAVAEVIAKAD